MNLEDDLHRAFRRQPAPPDFADRVLARIEPRAVSVAANAPGSRRIPAARWLALAAVIALAATGGARYYVYQQTATEAERVKAEIRLALRITGEKLALVRRKVQE